MKLEKLLPLIKGVAYIDSYDNGNCLATIDEEGAFTQKDCYSKEMLMLTNVDNIEAFHGTTPYIRIEVTI